MMGFRFAAVLMLLVLDGCWSIDPLVDAINAQFPPVSEGDQRRRSLSGSAAELARLSAGPDIALTVPVSLLQAPILEAIPARFGVQRVSLSTAQQLLKVDVEFDSAEMGGGISRASGTLVFHCGLAVERTEASGGSTLLLALLPSLTELSLREVSTDQTGDTTALAVALSEVVAIFADNISGVLGEHELASLRVPTRVYDELSPSRGLAVRGESGNVNVRVETNDIVADFEASAVSWLAHEGAVSVAVGMSQGGGARDIVEATERDVSFAAFLSEFDSVFGRLGRRRGAEEAWVGVTRAALSQFANSTFAQANVCIGFEGSAGNVPFNEVLEFPDASKIECRQTKECGFREIECRQTADCRQTSDCSRRDCTIDGPFGSRFDDPGCLAREAARKAACEARKSGRKLDCERRKTERKGACELEKKAKQMTCEVEKSARKLACETEKEAIKQLARTGKFARLKGSVKADAAGELCVSDLVFDDSLSRVELSLEAIGEANVTAKLKFTPLDIVGHFACPAPWRDTVEGRFELPRQTIRQTIPTEWQESSVSLSTQNFDIKVEMKPTLGELIFGTTNFVLTCPHTAGLLGGLSVGLSPFFDELQGEFVHTQSERQISIPLTLPNATVAGQRLMNSIDHTDDAIFAVARAQD